MKVNVKSILAVTGLSCLLGLSLPAPVAAHGKHRPQSTRADQVRRHGDAKMTKRVANHTVKEAILRYELKDLVSDQEVDRAKGEMYNFLKWKLGGPSAIAGQYVSSGYNHFEKAYTDEAAAMLLGVISFANKEPELVMPEWMQTYLKVQAGASGVAIAAFLQGYGVPAPIAAAIGSKVAEELTQTVQRNVKAFIPKSYDVDNRIVRVAIKARQEAGIRPSRPAGELADEDEEDEAPPPAPAKKRPVPKRPGS